MHDRLKKRAAETQRNEEEAEKERCLVMFTCQNNKVNWEQTVNWICLGIFQEMSRQCAHKHPAADQLTTPLTPPHSLK